ncbi:MAG: site-specific DNA-methyltransferase [Deltaproteobacteria bacterium]|nr:site-specific DNA-methyltransferase [Deltaproteobacteria bacterium]
MDGNSLNIKQDQIEKLKTLFPEAITEGKVDWEKLKATLGEDINFSNERYVLNWAGKSEAFKVLQEPTIATLVPDKEESVRFDDTGHIFIEGENLEVLKVLQKSYYGKVKMIYIDPPYNTGNDHFIYPDRFSESKEEYLKRVGEKDEEGYLTREGLFRTNSKDSGHYHSNWLNMMYPRLFLARNLLKDDGVIFVSIDDNEVHNLRLLMNEILGEENFMAQFVWKSRQIVDSRAQTGISNDHEYILVYSKSTNIRLKGKEIDKSKYSNPDNDPRGPWMSNSILGLATASQRPNLHYAIKDPETGKEYMCPPESGWRYSKETMAKKILDGRIVFPKKDNGRPREKKYLAELERDYTNLSSIIDFKIGYTLHGTREVREILDGNIFSFPKPVSLLKLLVEQGTQGKNEIVLDFFSGSGSLGQAIYELNKLDGGNRKYICIQLPEKTDEKSEAYKAGYKTIADIAKERIRRVIRKIEKEQKAKKKEKAGQLEFGDGKKDQPIDLGFKVFKLKPSNFKIWRGDSFENSEQLTKQLQAFTDPIKEGAEQENMLYELLLKAGFSLNSSIENKKYFYVVNGNKMVVALTKMSEEIVKEIIALKPEKCIALDKLFAGNDQLKTNTVLQMKDAGIEFKTI